MSSFYGGKQGRTYNIVQRYDSVAAMTQAFSGGGAYTGTNYGEYVLIDTVLSSGRSNQQNGLLYRRGFDYNDSPNNYHKPNVQEYTDPITHQFDKEGFNSAWKGWVQHPGAGAIYVGQIIGPEGRSPKIAPQNWEDFETQLASTAYSGAAFSSTFSRTKGKDGQEFNDVIQVGYVNIEDQHGDIVGGYIAFDIPETVIQAQVVDSNPYSIGGVVQSQSSIEHPFYYKWDFTIPAGKKGTDIEEFKVETGFEIKDGELDPIYDSDDLQIIDEDQYLTYSTRNYDQSAAGAITEHLGRWPYRVINSITQILKEREFFNWLESSSAQVGDIYLYPEEIQTERIAPEYDWEAPKGNLICAFCIKAGTVGDILPDAKPENSSSLFEIGYQFSSSFSSGIPSQWRVIRIPQAAPASSLQIDYKAGLSDYISGIRNLDHLAVDKEGKVYAFYSQNNTPYYLTTLRELDQIYFDTEKGQLVVKYQGQNQDLHTFGLMSIQSISLSDSKFRIVYGLNGYQNQVYEWDVKQLQSIGYTNKGNINGAQRIYVKYEGIEEPEYISDPFNNITAVGRQGDSILILYSDPSTRDAIPGDKKVIIPSWTDSVTGRTYTNLAWYNLGSMGGQFHVDGKYYYADLKGDSSYVDHGVTFTDLSEGFSGDREGWLVTVTDSSNNKHLYAYDYNGGTYNIGYSAASTFSSHWYEIMDLESSMIEPDSTIRISSENSSDTGYYQADSLNIGGAWFVISGGHD